MPAARATFDPGLDGRLATVRTRVKAADPTQAEDRAPRTGRRKQTQSA